MCRRWQVHCFLIPCCCHGDDEQTRVGWPCMRMVLLMLCALLSGPPPVMQGCRSLAALQWATSPEQVHGYIHVRQRVCVCVCVLCVCVCVCVCVHACLCVRTWCTYLKFLILAELLLESIVEQGAVDLLCSSLSAHGRHQGVQAVALRTLVLLSEDGKAMYVCVCVCARVCTLY